MTNAFTALLLPAAIGALLITLLLRPAAVKRKYLLILATAFPTGFSMISLILFWCYVMNADSAKTLTFVGSWVLLAGLLIWHCQFPKSTETPPSRNGPRGLFLPVSWNKLLVLFSLILFAYSLYSFLHYYLWRSVTDPYGGWDARYFWNLRARFYFRSPADWQGMFSPETSIAHPNYPLLLPGAVAWGWTWMGQETTAWPAIVGLVFFLSLLGLLIWHLAGQIPVPAALLAGASLSSIPAYRFWSTTQYADIPLAFFITAAVLALLEAIRNRERNWFLLAGFLAGSAAWTKDEGIFFILWACLYLAVFFAVNRKWTRSEKMTGAVFFVLGLFLPVASVLFLKTRLAPSGGDYLGSGRGIADYWTLIRQFDRTQFIAAALFVFHASWKRWHALWILFVVACGWLAVKRQWRDSRWRLAAAALSIELGYCFIMQVTPHPIGVQIKLALERLLLHPGVLALIFVFEVFGKNTAGADFKPAPTAPPKMDVTF